MTLPAHIYKKTILILLLAGIYACTRYIIFGEIYWIHIPTIILNKVIAVAAVFTLLISAFGYLNNNKQTARDWGIVSFHLAAYHVVLTLIVLSPENYGMFYWQKQLNLTGEIVMSSGLFGMYCYVMLLFSKHGTPQMALYKLLMTFSIMVHLFVYAFNGWLKPWQWNGYIPPISLLSFIFVAATFVIYLKLKDIKEYKLTQD